MVAAQAISSIYAAKKSADAVQNATAAQLQGSNRAIALENQRFQQAQQNMAPYMNMGQQGMTSLSSLLSQPRYQPFVPGQPNTFQPPPAQAGPPTGMPPSQMVPTGPMPQAPQPFNPNSMTMGSLLNGGR